MVINKGELLQLSPREILEVVYADDEKAVCLLIVNSPRVGWTYAGRSVVLSNKDSDYPSRKLPKEVKHVSEIEISGRCLWKPLLPAVSFPMV